MLGNSVKPSLLVLNNPPAEREWQHIKNFRKGEVRTALWAGNPFGWEWLNRLNRGNLDRIVCVSNSHREPYRLYLGFDKIEASHSGVDVDIV